MGKWRGCAIKCIQSRVWEGIETGGLRERPHNIWREGASLRRYVRKRKRTGVNTRVPKINEVVVRKKVIEVNRDFVLRSLPGEYE